MGGGVDCRRQRRDWNGNFSDKTNNSIDKMFRVYALDYAHAQMLVNENILT